MTTIDQALSEFRDAWIAGRRPDLLDYVERVPEDDRDELADAIHTWLHTAPSPDYDEATRAEIAADPILLAALAAGTEEAQPFAAKLRAVRERAGLAIEQLAERVSAAVGLPGSEARVASYLEQAETGSLDERRISRRLTEALASVLGADRDALRPTWTMAAVAAQHYRLDDADRAADRAELDEGFDLIARAATAQPPEAMDDVDRLFRGGPGY